VRARRAPDHGGQVFFILGHAVCSSAERPQRHSHPEPEEHVSQLRLPRITTPRLQRRIRANLGGDVAGRELDRSHQNPRPGLVSTAPTGMFGALPFDDRYNVEATRSVQAAGRILGEVSLEIVAARVLFIVRVERRVGRIRSASAPSPAGRVLTQLAGDFGLPVHDRQTRVLDRHAV
jgi:hypothetical protein